MHFNFRQIRMIGATVACCGLLASSGLANDPETGDEAQLETAFGQWVHALEEAVPPESGWVLPFATPRPAGLSEQDLKTVLSLRRLVSNEELLTLATLTEQVAGREIMPVQLRFWLSLAQHRLEDTEACLANLVALMETPDGWTALERGQIAWVLTCLPDQLFLSDHRPRAKRLYLVLAQSSVAQLSLWGNFQLAGMDFLTRDFAEAHRKYELVCESDEPGSWREQACGMSRIARQLGELNHEGESHGSVATVSP